MIVVVPDVLRPDELARCRHLLSTAQWQDGRTTAGHQAARVKRNRQLADDDPLLTRIGTTVLQAMSRTPLFIAAALPLRVVPPRFNCYEGGGDYGDHVDNAIFSIPGDAQRVRSDLSCTLFLSEPDEYDGGDLIINDTFGPRAIRLPAGHLVLYPGTSLHRVTPVTRGTRLGAFLWIQSLVREDHRRALLFELDGAIQTLGSERPDHPSLSRLTGIYHNLLREWSDT